MSDLTFTGTAEPVYSDFAADPDFEELLSAFADSIPQKQDQLRKLHRELQTAQLQVVAHQLKGTGGGYGFDGLTDVAGELVEACKINDANQVDESLERLLAYMERITF